MKIVTIVLEKHKKEVDKEYALLNCGWRMKEMKDIIKCEKTYQSVKHKLWTF